MNFSSSSEKEFILTSRSRKDKDVEFKTETMITDLAGNKKIEFKTETSKKFITSINDELSVKDSKEERVSTIKKIPIRIVIDADEFNWDEL